jgi:hypothetical protein
MGILGLDGYGCFGLSEHGIVKLSRLGSTSTAGQMQQYKYVQVYASLRGPNFGLLRLAYRFPNNG